MALRSPLGSMQCAKFIVKPAITHPRFVRIQLSTDNSLDVYSWCDSDVDNLDWRSSCNTTTQFQSIRWRYVLCPGVGGRLAGKFTSLVE